MSHMYIYIYPQQGYPCRLCWALLIRSTLQSFLHRQLWVPPFGAVTLIFAADAVAAAKEGKTMNFKVMRQKLDDLYTCNMCT